jgi:predicted nucleotidyltransferase component of viral defense system
MELEELNSFRLVGGTSLSLQIGHRMSVDIDLFTDAVYDSIDFNRIDEIISSTFQLVDMGYGGNNSMGKSYYVGTSKDDLVKLDIFYTDPFIYPEITMEGVRFAGLEEIAAMKLEVIGNGGRKKDFWDLHELLEHYSLAQMISFYEKRYPYSFSKEEIIARLTFFENANEDFDPICLRKKYWELIKLDFEERVKKEFN